MNLDYPVTALDNPKARAFGRRRMDIAIHAMVAVEVSLMLGLFMAVLQGLQDMARSSDDMRQEILAFQVLNKRHAELIFRLTQED